MPATLREIGDIFFDFTQLATDHSLSEENQD